MGTWVKVDDLLREVPSLDAAAAEQKIADIEALARVAVPCLTEKPLDDDRSRAVGLVLREAIVRWCDVGSGALSQRSETAGPFTLSESFDTRQPRRSLLWRSEIKQLQEICGGGSSASESVGGVSMIGADPLDPFASRPDLRFQWAWPAPVDDRAQVGW